MLAFSPRTGFACALVLAGLGTLTARSGGTEADAPISVDQLIARSADTPVSVAGLLYQDSSGTRLCGAVMESFPVQCGMPWAELVGLNIDTITGTTTEQGITWKEGVVVTVQRTDSGRFTVLGVEAQTDH